MKHVYRLFASALILGCSIFGAKAQNYVITPNDTMIAMAPYNQLSIYDIYMENTDTKKIVLSWSYVSSTIPAGWDYAICDLGTCYPGLPSGATMDTVDVGGMGFLGLNINPSNIPGMATVRMYVYEEGQQANGDTLTWIITSAPASISEAELSDLVSVHPNPASEEINIGLPALNSASVSIYHVSGREVYFNNTATGNETINISSLAAGVYYIRIASEGSMVTKQFIKK
jgi:hypothetical protein